MFEETLYILIGFLLFGIFFASLILPWIQLTHIRALRKEVGRLNDHVAWLIAYARGKGAEIPEHWEKVRESIPEKRQPEKPIEKASIPTPFPATSKVSKEKIEEPSLKKRPVFKDVKKNFEQKFA